MKKLLIVNSKNKNLGTSTNFNISFFDNVQINKYIKLIYALIPNTSYNISSSQFINIILSNDSNLNIPLIDGYYSISDLALLINNMLEGTPVSLIYNKYTYKISITCNDGNNIKNVVFSDSKLSTLLGFSNLDNIDINAAYFTSDKSVKINNNNLIYILFDKIENNRMISSNINMLNFIIPISVDSGNYIEYNYQSNFNDVNINNIVNPVSFQNLNVILKTENNEQFDNLNNDIQLIFEYI